MILNMMLRLLILNVACLLIKRGHKFTFFNIFK